MSGYLSLLASGFGLGLSVAAPLGPVSAAAIREGLERGALGAWLIGLGAATVDFVYLALVWAGVAPLLLRVPGLQTGFYLAGAALLGHMAWGSLRRAVEGGLPAPAANAGSRNAFLYGLGITMLNPATILSWLGLGGAFSGELTGLSPTAAAGVLVSVFAGSAAWFSALALAAGGARRIAGENPLVFRVVNLVAGLALGAFAVLFVSRVFSG